MGSCSHRVIKRHRDENAAFQTKYVISSDGKYFEDLGALTFCAFRARNKELIVGALCNGNNLKKKSYNFYIMLDKTGFSLKRFLNGK